MSFPGLLKKIALLGAFAGYASLSAAAVSAETVKLRFASTLPLTHHIAATEKEFAELVEEKTEGRVVVEHYPGGQLYPASGIQSAVATGALEIGNNLNALWTNAAIGELADIPFFLAGYDHANAVFSRDGEVFSVFQETLNRRGMEPLFFMNYGSFFDFANTGRQLVQPADFKGMQIRSYGALGAQSLQALGASPIVMDPGEMYLAVQRGTIDGVISGISSFHHRNLWEVSEYITMTGASMGVMAVVMNKTVFDNLAENDREAVLEAAKEAQDRSFSLSQKQDAESLDFVKKQGLSVYEMSDEERQTIRESLHSVFESWRDRATDAEVAAFDWADSIR